MGLIKKLTKKATKIGKGAARLGAAAPSVAYRSGVRPTFEHAVSPALVRAGKTFDALPTSQMAKTEAVKIGIFIDHPETLWNTGEYNRRWKERTGADPDEYGAIADAFRFKSAADTPFRQARDKGYANTSPWVAIPAQIAADPTTYIGVSAARIAAGAKGGIGPLTRALGRELVEQSGALALARVPTAPLGIWRGTQTKRLAHLKTGTRLLGEAIDEENSVKSLALGKARRMEEQNKLTVLNESINAQLRGDVTPTGIKARLRRVANIPDADTIEKEYIERARVQRALSGDTLDRADIMREVRANRATTFVGARVGLLEEQLQGLKAHALESQAPRSAGVSIARRLPGVKQLFDLVAPITLEDDPARLLFHSRDMKLTEIQDNLNLLRGDLNVRAQHAGLVADPRTRLVAGVGAKAEGTPATIDNILRYPNRFNLTPQQLDVINAFHTGRRGVANTVRTFLGNTPGLTKEVRAWVTKLGQGAEGGGEFIPRVATAIAPSKEAMAAYRAYTPGLGTRLARGVGRRLGAAVAPGRGVSPIPKGFDPVTSVRRGLGAKQATEYDRVLAEATDADRALFAHHVGDIFADYAGQITQIAADDGVILPLLRKMKIRPESLISSELDEVVTRTVRAKGKVGKARTILAAVGRGDRVSRRTLVTLKGYAKDEDIPEEMRVVLDNVAGHADRYITGEELGVAGAKAVSQEAAGAGGRGAVGIKGAQARRQSWQAEEVAATVTGATSKLPVEQFETLAEGQLAGITPQGYSRVLRNIAQRAEGRTIETIPEHVALESLVMDYMGRTGKSADDLLTEFATTRGVPEGLAQAPAPDATTIFEDTAAMRTAMRNAAKDAHTSTHSYFRDADSAIKAARQARMNAKKAVTVFDLRQSQIPGLSGTWFDKAVAKNIDEAYGIGTRDRGSAVRTAAAFNIMQQALQAGGDISATFLQSLAVLPVNPVGWAKALGYTLGSMVNPDIYYRYLEGLSTTYDPTTGKSIAELIGRSGLSLNGTEMYNPTTALDYMHVAGANATRAAEFIGNLRPNRAFSIHRNIAAVEMARSQIGLEAAILGRELTDPELQAIGRQVDLATGVVDTRRLGISPNRAAVERLFGRFGVQWFRSQTGRLFQAFNSGLDGRVARKMLFHQLGAMAALYVAAAEGLGQEPSFDPTSRDFMTIKVGQSRVRFGGIFHSIVRTVAETAQAVAEGDEEKLLEIRSGRNPVLNFWRSGAPFIGGLVADAVGINADSPYFKGLDEKIKSGEIALPFAVAAAVDPELQGASLKERAIAAIASGVGLTQTPQSPTDLFAAVSDQAARDVGYASWKDVPKVEQERLIAAHSDLAQAEIARQKWFDRGKAQPLDTAFDQTDKSRLAMNDVLAGLWGRVQAGQMDKAEWRTVYGDWAAKHAYFSENVFNSLPESERKRLDKNTGTVQDRLAAQFQAIQPTDTDGDGVVGEPDFKVWRGLRDAFWQEHPEAEAYRSYIQFDYPTRVWSSPEMAVADRERRTAGDLYDQFTDISKYKGLTIQEGEFFDALLSAKTRAAVELRAMAVQQGYDPEKLRIPAKLAWRYAYEILSKQGVVFDARKAQLLKMAAVVDADPQKKLQLINPGRFQFIRDNPLIVEWYPSAFKDTGIPESYLLRLGLIQAPQGQSLDERGLALAQGG